MKNKKFTDFYDAWWWLNESIAFYSPELFSIFNETNHSNISEEDLIQMGNGFGKSLCIEVQKVNPKSHKIEKDESKNTLTEVWLECGEYYYESDYIPGWHSYHNIKYDCGGETFEEAIINLANLVWKNYNTPKKIAKHREVLKKFVEQEIKEKN